MAHFKEPESGPRPALKPSNTSFERQSSWKDTVVHSTHTNTNDQWYDTSAKDPSVFVDVGFNAAEFFDHLDIQTPEGAIDLMTNGTHTLDRHGRIVYLGDNRAEGGGAVGGSSGMLIRKSNLLRNPDCVCIHFIGFGCSFAMHQNESCFQVLVPVTLYAVCRQHTTTDTVTGPMARPSLYLTFTYGWRRQSWQLPAIQIGPNPWQTAPNIILE